MGPLQVLDRMRRVRHIGQIATISNVITPDSLRHPVREVVSRQLNLSVVTCRNGSMP
jgi:hypothetical protein